MASIRYVKLRNSGTAIPIIGTGAWAPDIPEEQAKVKDWILTALKAGYRHIDTAAGYGTEKAVGEAIRESGINREDIYIVTKLPWNHHSRVAESIEESLENLGTKWVDLYLLHWPQRVAYEEGNDLPKNPDGTVKTVESPSLIEVWEEIENCLRGGKCEAIGVSNFSIKTLQELLPGARVVPAVNQVEMHPYLAQNELREFCAKRNIGVVAYTPSGTDIVRNDPLIVELAKKYSVTPTQIILAWHVARDVVAIPKSVNEERQKENINLPTLEEEDVVKINGLDRNQRICNKADAQGQVYGWTYEQLGW